MTESSLVIGKLKSFGSSLLGFAIMGGFLLLGAVLLIGVTKISAFLYPIFSALTGLSISIFVLFILLLSLIHKIRPFLSQTTMVLSMICGATIWLFSFLTIVGYLGWLAIFLLFMFQVVAPVAIIGLFFKQQWYAGLSIIVGLIITYGMRFYSIWLAKLYDQKEIDAVT